MNDKEIAIIIHNTDETACLETIEALQELIVPEDFEVDVIPVEGAEKYRAYNFAMTQTDAKYKIFLDVHISIRQKNILAQILNIFQADEKIGIIGTSGAVQLSTHGICLNSAKRCGKILSSARNVIDWGECNKIFREVEAVDGFFMATQYDLPWREDLFADDYFGDAAQCMEFRRQGYKSVVANQKSPWLWNRRQDCPIVEDFQRVFLEEYSAEIFPLVSVIIPTFNRPKYFQEALESVLNQTYRHFEIIVSDNSPNNDTENLIQPYLEKFPCIKYFHHKNFGANENWNFARQYNNPAAEYVNFLMDDDLFYPRKFEVMVEIYRNNPNVSIVTSFRDVIDENGKITGKLPVMKAFQQMANGGDFTINGEVAGKYMLMMGKNYIGEPSTVLIRKKFLRDNDLCWTADEAGFFPLVDISTWCQLLSQGDLFFVEETLNMFRRHSAQATNFDRSGAVFEICWARLFKTAWDRKIFIDTETEIRGRIINWIVSACRRLLRTDKNDEFVVTLEKTMAAMTEALYNGYQINLPEREYTSDKNIFS